MFYGRSVQNRTVSEIEIHDDAGQKCNYHTRPKSVRPNTVHSVSYAATATTISQPCANDFPPNRATSVRNARSQHSDAATTAPAPSQCNKPQFSVLKPHFNPYLRVSCKFCTFARVFTDRTRIFVRLCCEVLTIKYGFALIIVWVACFVLQCSVLC